MTAPEPNHSRFGSYFLRNGWVHALLLLCVWLFVFPFLWMVGTSLKTDEELPNGTILPEIPTFRASSPYIKDPVPPQRPANVSQERWKSLLPELTQAAKHKIVSLQQPEPQSIVPLDAAQHQSSAASLLLNIGVGKINNKLWAGDDAKLLAAFESALTPEAAQSALDESLARIDLLTFQIRSLDVHIYPMTTGEEFAQSWQVESGPAKLLPTPSGTTILSYDFSHDTTPVILKHTFPMPNNMTLDNLHKLILSLRADNSWHRIDAQFDLAGQRLTSRRTTYLAQFRPLSLLFQPHTFDDEMLRPKNWIPLREVGKSDEATERRSDEGNTGNTSFPSVASSLRRSVAPSATLRFILTPSNTLQAIWGKVFRNYLRAFDFVPFWKFMGNSILLVILTTAGSVFSASFVAYAFARLNWPGKSVSFLLLLATMMLPPQVTMIPGFLIWRALGWYNTLNPLWVPSFFGSAFFIFLMIQQMRTIPRELEEAARLDGLNPVQSWYYILLPNVKPTLAAIAILQFMNAWNDFLNPLIYLRDQSKFTLALGLYGLKVDQANPLAPDWTLIMAGDILMVLPVIAVFFLFQRYFVQGMTMTGMKG